MARDEIAGLQKSGGLRAKRGRPTEVDAVVGREALIEVTRQVLRTTPPGNVTRLQIAKAAGVDPALIRYYFGTVPHLIAEVVVATHNEIAEAMRETLAIGQPEEWLRVRVARLLDLFLANPYHNQLIRHVIYETPGSREHQEWLESLRQSIDVTEQQIRQGAAAGHLRPVDPRYLHLVLLGLTEFYGHNGPIVNDILGNGETNITQKERYVDFVADLLQNGLRSR